MTLSAEHHGRTQKPPGAAAAHHLPWHFPEPLALCRCLSTPRDRSPEVCVRRCVIAVCHIHYPSGVLGHSSTVVCPDSGQVP